MTEPVAMTADPVAAAGAVVEASVVRVREARAVVEAAGAVVVA
jgi:hypothetical protein